MLLLIFIYYFKNILSINDIQSLLAPLTVSYTHLMNLLNLVGQFLILRSPMACLLYTSRCV